MSRKLYLYWTTVRYLKLGQVTWRFLFKLKHVHADMRPAPACAALQSKVRFP